MRSHVAFFVKDNIIDIVEKVDDVVDDNKFETVTTDLLLTVGKRKTRLTTVADNERSNLRDLGIIKTNFVKELKNARTAINEHIDLLQNDVEQEMNKKYQNHISEVNKRLTDLNTRIKCTTNQYKVIKDTSVESALSLGQKYLKIMHLKHIEDGYSESHMTDPKHNLQSIADSKLSYVKTKDGIDIRHINRNLHEPKNGTDTSRGDSSKDTVESGSSTVELESQAFNWKLSNPVSKLLFTTPVKSSPYMPLTTSLPAESLHTSQVGFLKSSCITQTTHLPFVADSGNGSQFNFCVKKSFRIEKKNKDIFISDAKLMPNKYHIAIAKTSNPRCMMYTKDGFKKGQVQLLGKPDSIAVIEDHRIGVTLIGEKKVCVIDTDAWQCINTIDLNDSCKGVVYFENNLLANCINEGLMYINDSGKIVKENSNIKGEFYFHVDNQGNLFGAKEKIKRIHVCNLTNNKRYKYLVKGLSNSKGLTTDRDNNLFVSCYENDTIFVKQSLLSLATVAIEKSNGIDRPMSIDYDQLNDELLVVNNAGQTIFILIKN
ncbi:Hypothetical predicted protein [Mytilus galloprovincialis]|uniref:Uncharacterized protein n=1 Tax=Mytilus galloprovincialis TaxID=29158 RepID=A0A8B6HKQ5_MYTGA|nr:Hypothetical predicted protein [Mytilus galloprovincialis]